MKFRKTLLILSIVMGFIFFFSGTPKTSAFFISALPRVHGYRITKDYGIQFFTLGSDYVEINGYAKFVKYVKVFNFSNIVNSIIKSSGAGNACIDFRVSYQTASCELVTIVSKK